MPTFVTSFSNAYCNIMLLLTKKPRPRCYLKSCGEPPALHPLPETLSGRTEGTSLSRTGTAQGLSEGGGNKHPRGQAQLGNVLNLMLGKSLNSVPPFRKEDL